MYTNDLRALADLIKNDMEITVTSKVCKPATTAISKPKGALDITVVWVTVKNGNAKIELSFSKFDTEKEWYLDCQFTNGLPDFNHGEGSRCCLKKTAAGPLLIAIEKIPEEVL